ncbi:uncharacterized protein N7496_010429 [Penicillium cataractarum]|uniref:Transcription factor domain-containing protein n=1 Tax=Penicillium cataractarum TaxID=2100454 RepID=A0A9W9RR91_9EURO|nr:uncharacterized protein N7496_010429 [Penicillium cataractarum]KAJ5364716.1 hypothetical protein N7496_010429 [Penicillium cataractarum]
MDNLEWNAGVAETPTLDAHTTTRSLQGQRMMARKRTGFKPSPAQDLKFINLSHPDDLNQQHEVRTEIRRHVMKDIGQRRRRPRPKETSWRATQTSSSESRDFEISQPHGTNTSTISPRYNLTTVAQFPIEADTRTLELMHFLVTAPGYQPLKSIWIEIALCDSGAFHVTLGNAAHALYQISGDDRVKSSEALSHFGVSTRILRHRLNNHTESTSKGVIANILGHICLAIRSDNWDGWSIHMNGLGLIANARGGFADLGDQMTLLILLYDLAGSMAFDSNPRFELPPQLVGISHRYARQPAPRLQALLIQPMSAAFLHAGQALIMVSSIADVINMNSRSASFWKKDLDAIRLIGPCIHFLLSMPRPPSDFMNISDSEDLVVREVVRLTCLLLMSKLKESFAFPPNEQELLHARLADFFTKHVEILGKKYIELKVWALVTLALLRYHDGKDVYVQQMNREMLAMNKMTPSEFIDIARDIIWIDFLMSPFSEDLAADMNPFV